jgi:ATP-dependent exoDNAse (exonuclease V) alpha subunit
VVTSEERELFRGPYESQYFFDSRAFAKLPFQFVKLQKHYRQKDSAFIEMLNSIRNNTATDETIKKFNTRVDSSFYPKDSGFYVTLTTTNRQADEINGKRLLQITDMEYAYHCVIDGDFTKGILPADDTLVVKEGAQVMMLNNDSEKRWVNGSMGRVISIEHSQGENDFIAVELTDGSTVRVAPYTWELFKFAYDSTEKKIVSKTAGSFTQYPMMLAWAITIHKSQGKTFERVLVDVGSGTFAHGQLYVALSRCTTLEGIVLATPIERRHIIMDKRVVDFLRKIDPE